jgi:hypothetical protein
MDVGHDGDAHLIRPINSSRVPASQKMDDQRDEPDHQKDVDHCSRDVEGGPGDDPNAKKDNG